MDFTLNPLAEFAHGDRFGFLVFQKSRRGSVLRKAFGKCAALIVGLLCSRLHNALPLFEYHITSVVVIFHGAARIEAPTAGPSTDSAFFVKLAARDSPLDPYNGLAS